MSLKGKVIAITGAASGIGMALSHILAAEGCTLALADVNQEPLQVLAAGLGTKHSIKVMATQLDVRNEADVDKWISDAVSAFGRLDGAANMAGILRRSGLISESKNDEMESLMAVNFYGVLNCMRAQLRAMAANNGSGPDSIPGGSIVNAGSTASFGAAPHYASYIASKHAVLGITRTASQEVAAKGIRVNAVCPTIVQTTMVSSHEEEYAFKFSNNGIPLGRFAKAEEVAKMVRFLLSEDSSYINGTAQVMDGGKGASF